MTSDLPPCDRDVATARPPVGYLLMRVHRALRAVLDESLRPHGFTLPQVAVMFALGHRSGLSTAELARLAFVTPQAMGEVLAGLEAKGCVIRRAHDSHGRILPAELTATGLDARRMCHDVVTKAEAQMLSSLTPDEKQMLGGLLERCLEGLHDPAIEADHHAGSTQPQSRPLKARAEP